MNQCIHGIDLLRWMMGDEVKEVYGVTKQQFHDYLECEDIGMAVVKFKNGAVGTIEGTTNVYPKNLEETLYMFGETGTVKIHTIEMLVIRILVCVLSVSCEIYHSCLLVHLEHLLHMPCTLGESVLEITLTVI